jgi:hypothetical protein
VSRQPFQRSPGRDTRNVGGRARNLERRYIVANGFLGGPGFLDSVAAAGFDAIWPLDDPSGTVARDISGNALDQSVQSGYTAPTWAQAAGPPGTPSALFAAGSPGDQVARPSYPALTGDFTAAIFVKGTWTASPGKQLIGQGDPLTVHHAGWALGIEASNEGAGSHPIVYVGNTSTGPSSVECDNPAADDVFFLLGVSVVSGVWQPYVNGLAEGSTFSGAYNSHGGIWIGTDISGLSTHDENDAVMSWAMINATRGLTGAEWFDLYTAGVAHGFPLGRKVWTSLGDGSEPGWQDTMIEVEF